MVLVGGRIQISLILVAVAVLVEAGVLEHPGRGTAPGLAGGYLLAVRLLPPMLDAEGVERFPLA